MAFRKFQAEKIFDGDKFLEGQVVVATEAGIIEAVLPEEDAGDDIRRLKGILSPGLVNCHCHLELSHMKGRIPEKTGLVDFVFKVVTERHHPDTEIHAAIEAAEDEMLQAGIVAVGDICNNLLTIPQKQKKRLAYCNFIEASGWLPEVSDSRFDGALDLYNRYLEAGAQAGPRHCSIVPHAPYSVSAGLWTRIAPYFGDKVASIHNQETSYENEFFREGTGDFTRMYEMMKIDNRHHRPTMQSSLQSYFDRMLAAKNILLVHNTFTGPEDLDYIEARGKMQFTYFCICINANQYIEDSVPPLDLLHRRGCNIVLGTDSLASNHCLSIAGEIRTIRKHFPDIPAETILTWATRNGARALDMAGMLGSLEKGKRPGLVLFDENLNFIETLSF